MELFNLIFGIVIIGLSVLFFRLSYLYTSVKHEKAKNEMICLKKYQGVNDKDIKSNLSFYVRLPYLVTKTIMMITGIILFFVALFIIMK